MEDSEKVVEYKDHTIKLTPRTERCSLFAVTVLNREGKEIKQNNRAGKNEESALENAKKMIDFDIEYEKQNSEL